MFLQHLTVSEAHLCSPPIQPDKPVMGSLVSVLQLRVLGLSGVTQSHVSYLLWKQPPNPYSWS